jgi:hypothetical protein
MSWHRKTFQNKGKINWDRGKEGDTKRSSFQSIIGQYYKTFVGEIS